MAVDVVKKHHAKIRNLNKKIIHQLQKQAIQRIVIIRLAVVVKRKKKNLHLLAVTLQTVVKIPLNPVVVLIPKKI
ncbi:hypothetical protein [Acinetobacter bohemicus]|uniref:hypothetical protein n=1 Tax=Acinetobacter bohemicus TaxID=1435036 RepID=UPI00029A954E|nr:hypothetical protein [Acinetobacter bohemicus]